MLAKFIDYLKLTFYTIKYAKKYLTELAQNMEIFNENIKTLNS